MRVFQARRRIMLFQHIKSHLDTIPGNRTQVLNEPSSNIIFDRIEGYGLYSDLVQERNPARSRWKVQHGDQAGVRLNGSNHIISRITQHEHDIFLIGLFESCEMGSWGYRQVIVVLVTHSGAVTVLEKNHETIMIQALEKL